MDGRCAICGCRTHRAGEYARPTVQGRSHATRHHYVAERFFGRSKNRPGVHRAGIFKTCPWGREEQTAEFCYECHEELLHNPVFTPQDIARFSRLVVSRGLSEQEKSSSRQKLAGRIRLLHEVIGAGLCITGPVSPNVTQPLYSNNRVRCDGFAMGTMIIKLASGRTLHVTRFSFQNTYSSLLAGLPTSAINQQIIERAKLQAAQIIESSPVHVIPPKIVTRTHAGGRFPIRCSTSGDVLVVRSRRARYPELPPVTCMALLEDVGDSMLTVVWFRDDCSHEPILKVIESAVRDIPWNDLAGTADC